MGVVLSHKFCANLFYDSNSKLMRSVLQILIFATGLFWTPFTHHFRTCWPYLMFTFSSIDVVQNEVSWSLCLNICFHIYPKLFLHKMMYFCPITYIIAKIFNDLFYLFFSLFVIILHKVVTEGFSMHMRSLVALHCQTT